MLGRSCICLSRRNIGGERVFGGSVDHSFTVRFTLPGVEKDAPRMATRRKDRQLETICTLVVSLLRQF